MRLPLYTLYNCFKGFSDVQLISNNRPELLNRKFCNFLVSNSRDADPIREQFFKKLSEYKQVDSGGRFLNNIGHTVPNKLDFIRNYKFTIAFENSASSGYTTEKLIEPMAASSIPIYWGNPNVHLDFNKKSFVCVNDFENIDEAINEIIRLDTNSEAYINMLSESRHNVNHKKYQNWMDDFDAYINHIIDQPIEKAKRCTKFGYSKYYRKRTFIMSKVCSLPILKPIIRKLSYWP